MARPREMRERISEVVRVSAGTQAGVIPMLPVVTRAKGTAARSGRWGVILAGGAPRTGADCGGKKWLQAELADKVTASETGIARCRKRGS